MTPELKAKWLEDLRSGKYPKTKEYLKDNQGYCCLGVLLETAGIGFNGIDPNDFDLVDGGELSKCGRVRFGLSEVEHNELISLNDRTQTFAEVIDYIEHNL